MQSIKIYDSVYIFFIPESNSTNISHLLFDDKITFVNSQPKITYSKDDFVLKTGFNVRFKDFSYTKINLSQIWNN